MESNHSPSAMIEINRHYIVYFETQGRLDIPNEYVF